MTPSPASLSPAQTAALTKITSLRRELEAAVYERKDEIDAMLTALLARQHLLLLGPPGTAKSMLAFLLAKALRATTFTRLMTKHSVPEELFGPYSLVGLEQDRYERKTQGYLPEAQVALLDEVFKANSAILNALLTLLNERAFDNGNQRLACPLEFCLGMSNETPKDDGLEALYDRFTVRRWTSYISDADHFKAMLCSGEATVTVHLSAEDIAILREMVAKVTIPSEVLDAIVAIRTELAQKGIQPSDRRYRSLIGLVKAQATLRGATEATPEDLFIAKDCLWDRPEDAQEVASVVLAKASPELNEATRLRDAAIEAFQKLDLSKIEAGPAIKVRKELEAIVGQLRALRATPKIVAVTEEVAAMDAQIKRAVSKAMGL
jgi:MoxR-like ATPase